MRPVCYSVAASLDGLIAGPNGEFDWIPMDPEVDFKALFARFDTLLMGRKTWLAAQKQGGASMPGMKSFVFSTTLQPADCPGAVLSSEPAQTVRKLKQQPGKDIWLFGGGSLLKSLLELELVDQLQVAIVPVLLGNGLPLVEHPAKMAKLELASHRVYQKTGTVLLDYRVLGGNDPAAGRKRKDSRPERGLIDDEAEASRAERARSRARERSELPGSRRSRTGVTRSRKS